jgi:hypothetical protein
MRGNPDLTSVHISIENMFKMTILNAITQFDIESWDGAQRANHQNKNRITSAVEPAPMCLAKVKTNHYCQAIPAAQ